MQTEPVKKAGRILRNGGVVTYPTEGVFGLGCVPDSMHGIARILEIKQRDPAMGLILIASQREQLAPWTDSDIESAKLESSAADPVTWIVPPADNLPYWITGSNSGVAVRITAHPVASALCDAAGSALVSTSANRSGHAPARTTYVLRRQFRDLVDYIVPGDCGPAPGPSEIRHYSTHKVIRAAKR
jgi:L-threonylcarbamoyladenylate synthase